MANRLQSLVYTFSQLFGGEPVVVRAPGRVNLIGEHTDYNDGFVLPVAIDRDVLIAARRRDDRRVRLFSLNFSRASEFNLDAIGRDDAESWSNYARGVAFHLLDRGQELRGMDALVEGNVPIGSGLSSSAALEVAAAEAFGATSGFEMDRVEMALLCQRAENHFVGVNCGVMDQFISVLGRRDHALLIDCRSLAFEAVPLALGEVRVVICDTTVRRGLATSEYNVRRRECEEAAAFLRPRLNHEVTSLRDVSVDEFVERADEMPADLRKRAEHVIAENARTLGAVAALRRGALEGFGTLMNASHESLRDLYQVSSPELDAIVEAAWGIDGVLGARMTGAGFGGCAVALVRQSALADFQERVGAAYLAGTGRTAVFHVCQVVDGSGHVKLKPHP